MNGNVWLKRKKALDPEARFSRDLGKAAAYLGASWLIIPDPQNINKKNRATHHEKKRPCDGIFNSEHNTRMLELKYGYNGLMPHQLQNMLSENAIRPNSYLLVRKVHLKAGVSYRIEVMEIIPGKYNGKPVKRIICDVDSLEDLIMNLKELK